MIGDIADLPDGQVLECDVCVAGAGAAGLTLALALTEAAGLRVVALEGGGRDIEVDTQESYAGRNVGREYMPLDACRLRFLGGSTNHWEGTCAPLSPIDFAARPWVPHSGWPIGHADLAPYYERAAPLIGTGSARYDRPEGARPPAIPEFDPAKLETRLYRLSDPLYLPHRLHAREIETRPNLRVLLHANLVRVQLAHDAGAVGSFRARGPDGRAVEVRARAYVLALGGIENPRLLLASDDVAAAGVGNGRDLVGRFFQEHVWAASLGTCVATGPWDEPFDKGRDGGGAYWTSIVPSDAWQERERALNCSVTLHRMDTPATDSAGFRAFRRLRRQLLRGEAGDLGGDAWRVLADLGDVVGGYRDWNRRPLGFEVQVEQAPDPDSRVTLDAGGGADAQGLPRLTLDWRLGEPEKRTMRAVVLTLAAEFGRLGLGRVQVPDWLAREDLSLDPSLEGAYHHIGTTRMSATPATGVVDGDCRVHGVGNLYVAGSSVFPTGGYANPTLTIVALALRLADHLRGGLAA